MTTQHYVLDRVVDMLKIQHRANHIHIALKFGSVAYVLNALGNGLIHFLVFSRVHASFMRNKMRDKVIWSVHSLNVITPAIDILNLLRVTCSREIVLIRCELLLC